MIVQVLYDIQMTQFEVVWDGVHQLEGFLQVGKRLTDLFAIVEVETKLVHDEAEGASHHI